MALNRICNLLRVQILGSRFMPMVKREIHSSTELCFRATPCLWAEPLKKKKRIDPMILRHREERKKKKIEKQIRRLEKNARQLKPIEEVNVPFELIDEKQTRKRNIAIDPVVVEERQLLKKEWARYKLKERLADAQMLDRIIYSQQRALDELRSESEELYQAAVKIDESFLPFSMQGPVETPPIKDYESPDGEYFDETFMIRIMEGESGDDLGSAFLSEGTYMVHGDDLEEDVDGNLSAENTDEEILDSDHKMGTPLREQDRFLPIANVAKIMKKAVPDLGKIAKDARECVQECVSEFISFITSEASERCHMEKRKTINGEDILFAMTNLGFDNYVEPLKVYLQKYREATKGDKIQIEEFCENKVFTGSVITDGPNPESVTYIYSEQMQQYHLP